MTVTRLCHLRTVWVIRGGNTKSPTAEDEKKIGEHPIKGPIEVGPAADPVDNGSNGHYSVTIGDHDSTTSDTTSLDANGRDTACTPCLVNKGTLTSPSIVSGITEYCAKGSEPGVDDHSAKLPVPVESSVWACISSWCGVVATTES